jgi:alginate O-acetyltransferase complex protein AlgI
MRLIVLLLASYYFYARWNEKYLFLIIFSTSLDYFCALGIEHYRKKAKLFLSISILGNLSMLFFFKYYGFFAETALKVSEVLGRPMYLPILELILPVGISFYTLQTMSYSCDVYKKVIKAESNFLCLAVYVANFPQLVAGPIERAGDLIPQFKKKLHFNEQDFIYGLQLICWGLFKKVVIADRLSAYVEWGLNSEEIHTNEVFLISGYFAQILIYADFSAYADIAKGSAKLLGINLMDNFKFPLFSRSMPEFWKRWHVSFHNWFLNYVYYPLGGGRVGFARVQFNIFIVFITSGLWHGSAWRFILWGIFHYSLVVIHMLLVSLFKRMSWSLPENSLVRFLQINLVLFQRAMSMYLFFITDSEKAVQVYKNFFIEPWTGLSGLNSPFVPFIMLISFLFPIVMILCEYLHLKISWSIRFNLMSRFRRWSIYYLMLFLIMIFGVETNNPFIYFQF